MAFTCTDPGTNASGIASCVGSSALDSSINTSIVGSFTFTVTATDNAGHVTVEQASYSVTDRTPPVITITTPNPDLTTTVELGTSGVTASYSCFDATDPAPTCDGLVGTTTVDSGEVLPSASLGTFTLTVTSTDQAGNTSSTSTDYEVVDTTAPSVGIEIVSDPLPVNGWNAGDVTVTINASDASGPTTITYRTFTDGGLEWSPWADYDLPFSVTTEGTTLIEGLAVDGSGNSATTAPITVKIDKTAPAISSTLPTSVIVGSTPLTVEFTCTDTGGSGVASCTSAPAQGEALDTSVVGTVSSFTVTAVDNVGNIATETFTIAVGYNVCLLYNDQKGAPSTGAFAVKLQLCDANGVNYSSPEIILTALSLDNGTLTPQDSGSSNSPTYEFRYDEGLEGYIYNLNEDNLEGGDHYLQFSVSTTPGAEYEAHFKIKVTRSKAQ